MPTIKLLANAGDWLAGSVQRVGEKQAQRLIRTGYAVEYHREPDELGLTGAERKKSKPERTH